MRKERQILKQVSDPSPAYGDMIYRLIIKEYRPFIGRQTTDDIEQGCLPGTGRAQKNQQFAVLDLQADISTDEVVYVREFYCGHLIAISWLTVVRER